MNQSERVGQYFYDGEGRRVKKITNTETTVFVYSAGKLIAEYSTQISRTPQTKYLTQDHLGTPRIITNELGAVVSRRDFMPFGEELHSGVGARSAALQYGTNEDTIRQKFTGYERDNETALDFAEARMYANNFGRFTAVDPLLASGMPGNPQTWNRYTYVLNNPLFWVDPTGLIWGKNEAGQVRWFDKKLGKGFSEFTPEAWQYVAKDGRIVQLDPNSSKWNYIDPVEVVAESSPIQELAQAVTDGVTDGFTGIAKGVGNSPFVALNGVTGCIFNCGVQAAYFQGSNPLEVPLPFTYHNEREASYGSASSTGTLLGVGLAGGALAPSGTVPSVIPVASRPAFPTIGPGPFAAESIPARGPGPLNAAEQAQINAIGGRNGCHTCGTFNPGTKSGNFVGDHQLPSKMITPGTPQRIYPQCLGCSRRQGGEVRKILNRLH